MSKKIKCIVLSIILVLCLGGIGLEIKLLYPKYINSINDNKVQKKEDNSAKENDNEQNINNEDNEQNNGDEISGNNVNDKTSQKKVTDLDTISFDNEYQVVCTYKTNTYDDLEDSFTETYQKFVSFYDDGTCQYEFAYIFVYNSINDYNKRKNDFINSEHYDECINDYIFDDDSMTLTQYGGMGHSIYDGGEQFWADKKFNSIDELKEQIQNSFFYPDDMSGRTCVLYEL